LIAVNAALRRGRHGMRLRIAEVTLGSRRIAHAKDHVLLIARPASGAVRPSRGGLGACVAQEGPLTECEPGVADLGRTADVAPTPIC
jgi:hypothetical protein